MTLNFFTLEIVKLLKPFNFDLTCILYFLYNAFCNSTIIGYSRLEKKSYINLIFFPNKWFKLLHEWLKWWGFGFLLNFWGCCIHFLRRPRAQLCQLRASNHTWPGILNVTHSRPTKVLTQPHSHFWLLKHNWFHRHKRPWCCWYCYCFSGKLWGKGWSDKNYPGKFCLQRRPLV